jgi:small subunit ribosomal protein S2
MSLPSIEELLKAGSHFGHQTRRWNPKMKPYILTQKNGIYVINLEKTQKALENAGKIVSQVAASGRGILFIGTKVTSKKVIREAAESCGNFFVTHRWLGGMLTNFKTVRNSIRQLEKIEQMEKDGTFQELQKKEVLTLTRKRDQLELVFGGIRNMKTFPGLVVISDIRHEHIAVAEARRLKIPIIAICDTNVNPELVEYPIPANDDAVKSVKLIADYLAAQAAASVPASATEVKEDAQPELEAKGEA